MRILFEIANSDTSTAAKLSRELGLGRRLVQECITFARRAGYQKLVLWTDSQLKVARNIYGKARFKLVEQEAYHSFGKDWVGETWGLVL